jgi:hypothetical protein
LRAHAHSGSCRGNCELLADIVPVSDMIFEVCLLCFLRYHWGPLNHLKIGLCEQLLDSIINTYPLWSRLTISKFSFAIRSSSLFLTPSLRLRGFMLIDLLVTCWVVGTDARFPWDISSRFLINIALFLLIWFSRSI